MSRSMLQIVACTVLLGLASQAGAAEPPPSRFDTLIGEAKAAMMGEPEKALTIVDAAAVLAEKIPDAKARALAVAQTHWLKGEALTRVNKPEEARPIVQATIADVSKIDPRSKLHGDLLLSIAAINMVTGKLPEALNEMQAAYAIFVERGEARSQAKVLQMIGSIYFDARDYPRVLKYYEQSAEAYDGDPNLTISAYNNIGDTLKETKRFREAEVSYRKALEVAREIESPLLEVRVLTNIASLSFWAGDYAKANRFADLGLVRARGQDSGWDPYLWGVKAQVAFARKDYAHAETFLDRTFAGTDPNTTLITFREFHETAYRLYQALGNDQEALVHLKAFKRLDDEAREVAASTNSALATARFDFANQELRITKLKAGQLQRDIALERSRARLHSTILYGALGTAAIILIGTLFAFFSIRRSRNEVRAANAELSDVNVELNKALAAKTRFLATTSHEIRTPLNGILGMTQIMLHDRQLPDVQRDRVQVVHDAGSMMKALVDDILDVAKIETGNLTVEQVEVELPALFNGVARLWQDEAEAKGLTFEASLEDCPARMVSDPRRLRQIVFNLMSNAVKFTERGRVRLSASAVGDELLLAVSDTGVGIPADQHETVFESFHQVDGELTRQHGGTGLGLAICRELAQALGGSITLESEPGVGSTFTVRLPLGCPASSAATEEASSWPADLAAASVLVVEPNALTRSILVASLSPAANEVKGVAPEDAAAALKAGRFHHVVADLAGLAALGDPNLLVEDFAQGGHRRVTLLASVPPEGEHDASLRAAGARQILKRPIAVAELIAALAKVHAPSTHDQAIAA